MFIIRNSVWKLRRKIINILFNISPGCKILLYHSVFSPTNNNVDRGISLSNFAIQMKYLRDNYNLISLDDLDNKLNKRALGRKSVAVTFDDGFLNNYAIVVKVLKKHKIPATFFVTLNASYFDEGLPLMSTKQMKTLSENSLFNIGAHTMTHPKLSKISKSKQEKEILESKKELEKIINKKVNYFAYPYGQKTDYTKHSAHLVKKSGFEMACSAFIGNVNLLTNRYELPRYPIKNWNIDDFRRMTGL